MTEVFAQILTSILSLVPRLRLLRRTHRAVVFCRGGRVRIPKPGLFVWWPLVAEVVEIPVARQTLNLTSQSLVTADGKTLVVSAVVVYEIVDVEAALCSSWDVEETITDVALTSVARVLSKLDYDQAQTAQQTGGLQRRLSTDCARRLEPFGVKVLSCALSDFSTCRVFRLLNG